MINMNETLGSLSKSMDTKDSIIPKKFWEKKDFNQLDKYFKKKIARDIDTYPYKHINRLEYDTAFDEEGEAKEFRVEMYSRSERKIRLLNFNSKNKGSISYLKEILEENERLDISQAVMHKIMEKINEIMAENKKFNAEIRRIRIIEADEQKRNMSKSRKKSGLSQ